MVKHVFDARGASVFCFAMNIVIGSKNCARTIVKMYVSAQSRGLPIKSMPYKKSTNPLHDEKPKRTHSIKPSECHGKNNRRYNGKCKCLTNCVNYSPIKKQ